MKKVYTDEKSVVIEYYGRWKNKGKSDEEMYGVWNLVDCCSGDFTFKPVH